VTALLYVLGVLFVAVGIALSIALHEIGHLVPAKRFGVKVTQYMVGFGPTLWSRRRGETEYGVKWIPLGGYIRMIGMFPPKPGDDPTMVRATSTGRLGVLVDQAVQARVRRRNRGPGLAEQARQQSLEEIQPGDEQRVFYRLSAPRKVVVMLGGPFMNLLIAAVLITIIVVGFGTAQQTTKLGSVSKCLLAVDAPATATCQASDQPAPAAAAGLKPGEVITSFDGRQVRSWEQARQLIRASGDRAVVLGVRSPDGRTREVPVRPVTADRPRVDDEGQILTGADGRPLTDRVGFLGVSPATELVPQSPAAVPGVLWKQLSGTAGVVLRIPQKMVGVAKAAFGSGERDPNGPISVVGAGRFAGEIASVDVGAGYGPRERLADLTSVVAALNLALFVFNLIPLLPLDGGHVAGALWEGLRRSWSRLRRRPDPGPADVARLLPVAYAVSGLLVVMSVLLIYADIVRPIRLGG
jgi:membrane-associated protease RseP (regulator of RpoE activity)